MKIHFRHPEYTDERLSKAVFSILEAVNLCSIATVGNDGVAHINAAYFCYTADLLDIYFVSDPSTKHGQNMAVMPQVALAIFDTNQAWGAPLKGLQLFGRCHLASTMESASALMVHASRFKAYAEYINALNPFERERSPHKFYVFRPTAVKILDERDFGEESFVAAELVRA